VALVETSNLDKPMKRYDTVSVLPTVFHITHYKSGSQWVLQVLRECAPDRFVTPHVDLGQFYKTPLIPGAIYPTVYVSFSNFQNTVYPSLDINERVYRYSETDEVAVKNWYNFSVKKSPVRKFVIIRDLRDTLVSLYFSVKISHALVSRKLEEGRKRLKQLDMEDGFLEMMEPGNRGDVQAIIQASWQDPCRRGEALLFRYEDMIADEVGQFEKIISHCEIDIPRQRLREIIMNNSFLNRTGRKPGDEDTFSHYRKGMSGDWKNYFTDRIKARFKERFGQNLIELGYEKDMNW
jgi:lipopolysaccharide transport system ATP-binding protein